MAERAQCMIDEISNVFATESCFEHSVVAFDILGLPFFEPATLGSAHGLCHA